MERRRSWLAGALLLIALVAALTWRAQGPGPVRLADGSQLAFHGVTIGMGSSWFYGSTLSRIAQSLPPALQRYLPDGTKVSRSALETNLVFWLHRDRLLPPADRVRFSVADDQGNVVLLRLPPVEQVLPEDEGGASVSVAFPTWPRGAATLVLQIHDSDLNTSNQLAGQWRIRNPAPVSPALWSPESIPVLRPIGEGALVLEAFETRPMPVMRSRLSHTNEIERRAFLTFGWTNAGAPPAKLVTVRLHDAVGNVTPWSPVRQARRTNSIFVPDLTLPWPGASAYQIESRWSSSAADRAPTRISIQVLLTKPLAAGETSREVGRATFDGSILSIRARAAPGESGQGWNLSAAMGRALLQDPPSHEVELIEATDESGRRWPAHDRGELTLPLSVGSVTATVAVQPLITLRFIAEPIRRTNSLPRRR